MTLPPDPATILVVDDNPTNLEVLYNALDANGYDVRVEIDGNNAIAQVQTQPPDLILLDIMLPGLDGFEVCRQLKSDPRTHHIPIIFMTALTETTDKVKGFELGAVDYITKPFQQEEALARVRLHLQLRHLTNTLEVRNQELKKLTETLEDRVAERTQDLRQNQAYLKLLERAVSASNNGIVIVDAQTPDHPVQFVNPAFEKITGYSQAEVVGRNCRFLQGPDSDQPGLTVIRNALKDQKSCTVNLRNYHKDGRLFWNELSISPIFDEQGSLSHYVGIQTDVSARKSVENKLWDTNLRLSALLQSLQSGILVEDENREIVVVNQAFCDLFAIAAPPEALIGNNCEGAAEASKGLFRNSEQFLERVQQLLSDQQIVIGEELELVDNRILERDYIPIIADGLYRGHLWQYRDISERKQSEAQIKASLLEKEILLKEIHHRVKNNLLVVSSLLEWQTDYVQDPSWVKMINESQNRIQSMALIHEKLYQSKSLARINLSEYLETLIQQLLLSFDLGDKQIEVLRELEPIFLNIETVTPCGLIVNELVSNAFEHAFLDRHTGHLWITVQQAEDNRVKVVIKDDGVGLPHDFDLSSSESMGFQLVSLLTQQLEGDVNIRQETGTEIQLTFAELQYKQRV